MPIAHGKIQRFYLKIISKLFGDDIYENKIFLNLAEIKPLVWLFTFGNQPRFKRLAIQEIGESKPKHVFQMGCVPGSLSRQVAETILGYGNLYVVDISENVVEFTRKKIKGLSNIQVVKANAASTKFPNSTFDTIIIFFLLHEIPKDTKLDILREASRLLAHDGFLLIADYHRADKGKFNSCIEKIVRTIEPLSGELMDLDLPEILRINSFQVQKIILGTFALYQFIIAKKT